jgi:hypothetical protein
MADGDLGAVLSQRLRVVVLTAIATGYPVPSGEKQSSDSAHARTPDPNEVNGSELGGELVGEVGFDRHGSSILRARERGRDEGDHARRAIPYTGDF